MICAWYNIGADNYVTSAVTTKSLEKDEAALYCIGSRIV